MRDSHLQYVHTQIYIDRQIDRYIDRQTDRQIDRYIDETQKQAMLTLLDRQLVQDS